MLLQGEPPVYILLFILIIILLVVLFIYLKQLRNDFRNQIGYKNSERGKSGYIYFYRGKFEITNLFLVKIGRTNNMKQRMSAAKTSNPFGVHLMGCVRVKNDVFAESFIHSRFKRYRLNNWGITDDNEWFFAPPIWFYIWLVNDEKLRRRYM